MDYIELFEMWYVIYYIVGSIFILLGLFGVLFHKRLAKNNRHKFIIISVVLILLGISCLTIGPVIVDKVVTYHRTLQ